ncbi:MAG: hypothetical protein ABI255_07220 [Microbacteriaceae bacterium]
MQTCSLVVLIVIVIEAVLSLIARWPYQFGGPGNPDAVWSDFISHGTALSPPMFLIVVLAVLTLGVRLRGWVQLISGILLAVLSLAMTIGAAGELLSPTSADVPWVIQFVGSAINAVLAVALLAITAMWLVTRWRARGQQRTVRSDLASAASTLTRDDLT